MTKTESFFAAYKAFKKAKAAYDSAPDSISQSEEVWLETAFREALDHVLRAPVVSVADAAAAIRFCRTEMPNATDAHVKTLQYILSRTAACLTGSERRAA